MTMTRSTWRQRAATTVIMAARRMFANTPIQKLPITTAIYTKVFRLGTPQVEVTTKFRGIALTFPTKDTTIVPGLVGGFYEELELDVFERIAAMSNNIIDVGANIGLYSTIAADRAPSFGRVVAFEPVSDNLRYLYQNREQNERGPKIVVEESAVGEADGEIDIFMAAGSIGTHSASATNALNSTVSVHVPVVSLDSYVSRSKSGPVDLLKIDVEGYEVAVLRGAKRLLRHDKPTLFIEFVPDSIKNCGFEPREFVDFMFDTYEHVFLADEPRSRLALCTKNDLLDPRGGYKNMNLIAVDRNAHRLVVGAIANLNGKRVA